MKKTIVEGTSCPDGVPVYISKGGECYFDDDMFPPDGFHGGSFPDGERWISWDEPEGIEFFKKIGISKEDQVKHSGVGLRAKNVKVTKRENLVVRSTEPKITSSWVYVLDTGWREQEKIVVKIGHSINLTSRILSLQAGNPKLKLLFAGYISDKAVLLEKKLHATHNDKKLDRELFLLSAVEIKIVEQVIRAEASDWTA